MKPNYAICRTEKVKSWGSLAKSVGHNIRTTNEDRSHLRQGMKEPMRVLLGHAGWVEDWKKQVEEMHLRKLQIGQAHTLAREFFLGMSPEWMEGKSKRDVLAWAENNIVWAQERFGAERVKFAVLHLDEQTPHIALYVVPLKKDLKQRGNGYTLSDRELGLGGNKEALSELQTEYAAAMEKFELTRGLKGSKTTHKKTAEWRREMKKAEGQLPKVTMPTAQHPALIDRLNIEDYGQRVAKQAAEAVMEQMKPFHTKALQQATDLKAQAKEIDLLSDQLTALQSIADAFKQLLAFILGQEPDFSTMQSRHEALTEAAKWVRKHKAAETPRTPTPRASPAAKVPPSRGAAAHELTSLPINDLSGGGPDATAAGEVADLPGSGAAPPLGSPQQRAGGTPRGLRYSPRVAGAT